MQRVSVNFEIDIRNTSSLPVSCQQLEDAVRAGLVTEGVIGAVLSITVVGNDQMQQLNRQHLQHDYPTDVISFQLDWMCDSEDLEERLQLNEGRSRGAHLEGEIVVSSEYAAQMADRAGWSADSELTLYAIHGMLHICRYDDLTPAEKRIMRNRERCILKELGLEVRYPDDVPHEDDEPPGSSSPAVLSECRHTTEDHS
ncbi:MAG: rRNA maturation RNase YbeY [Planctomycetaceae bacterium]